MKYDLVLKNGTLIDGSGAAARRCDVAVSGDKIAFVGSIDPGCGAASINASGLVLAPGFIDVHSHSDFFCLLHPESNSKIYDGVTTEICGNCGSSPFPVRGELLDHRREGFRKFGLEITWTSAGEFFDLAEARRSSINRAFLVGHGNLRANRLGYRNVPATGRALSDMKDELSRSLSEGAFGLSSGLSYPPGCYSAPDEMEQLCRIVREFGAIYASHLRDEGDMVEESIVEAINVAVSTGVKTHISHLKTAGKRNWNKLQKIKERLDHARGAKGMALTCDRYPYTALSTDLDSILPKWVYEGGVNKEITRLRDRVLRNKIRGEFFAGDDIDKGFWQEIVIASVSGAANKGIEGKSIWRIARDSGSDPFETVCDLIVEEHAAVDVVRFNMSEENLQEILQWDFVMIGSDSSIRSTDGALNVGKPHPRSYGTFARTLGMYCRERALLSLEEAVYKMTGLPAKTFGIDRRGVIRPGYFADLVIFDKEAIRDTSEFADPHKYSTGIKYVIVNGKVTIANGVHEGTLAGAVLRR